MTSERKPGYYWVRSRVEAYPMSAGDWVVAEWSEGEWFLPGSDESWDEQLWQFEVGERLEPPAGR